MSQKRCRITKVMQSNKTWVTQLHAKWAERCKKQTQSKAEQTKRPKWSQSDRVRERCIKEVKLDVEKLQRHSQGTCEISKTIVKQEALDAKWPFDLWIMGKTTHQKRFLLKFFPFTWVHPALLAQNILCSGLILYSLLYVSVLVFSRRNKNGTRVHEPGRYRHV